MGLVTVSARVNAVVRWFEKTNSRSGIRVEMMDYESRFD